jgi:hypothetical protein
MLSRSSSTLSPYRILGLCVLLAGSLTPALAGSPALRPLDDASAPARLSGKTAAGTWTMGEAILGGEREEGRTADGWRIAWDGIDNDPGSFDATGLGGVDLTAGAGDRLVATWSAAFEGAKWIELEIWSRETGVSRTRIPLDGESVREIEIPFAALEGEADLRDVGAVRLTVGIDGGAPAFAGLAVGVRAGFEKPAAASPAAKLLGPAPVPATLVLQDGDMPTGGGGNPVTSLNATFVNNAGDVGFTGNLDNGGSSDGFVFSGAAVVHLNSAVVGNTLAGGESTMGIDDGGGFIFSPSIDGDDGVWSQNGQVAVEGTQAPGFPGGTNSTFHSRPTMIPPGAAYWVAGFDDTGGTTTQGRMLYTSSDATAGNTTVVLRSDDLVGGTAIDRPSGIDFDYDFSNDGSHHVSVLLLDTGSTTNDGIVYVDGTNVAQETGASGDGDNWDNFDAVAINDSGDYLFSGDTDGATASDEFIAYNGSIALREGDLVDGVTLGSSVLFLAMNNRGAAIHAWTGESLFYACDASDLAGTSVHLLTTGASVDLDDDGVSDATVTDFNTSGIIGPTGGLDPGGRVYLEVDLDYGGGDVEAVIGLRTPACGLIINEIDYDQTGSPDDEEFIEIYNGTGAPVNLDSYSLELVDGSGGGATVYQTIDLPNVDLADGDYYVVCADAGLVPNCDLDVTPDTDLLEDGAPDAVALLDGAVIVDTVSYEGDSGAPYTEDSGAGVVDDPANAFFSISRVDDGIDSDRNGADFAGRCNSPGLANLATTTGCVMIPVELIEFSVE